MYFAIIKRSRVTVSGLLGDLMVEDAPLEGLQDNGRAIPSLCRWKAGKAPEPSGGSRAGWGGCVCSSRALWLREGQAWRLIYGGCVGLDSLLAVHLRLLQKRCCVLGAWYAPVHGLKLSGLITDNVRFCPKLRGCLPEFFPGKLPLAIKKNFVLKSPISLLLNLFLKLLEFWMVVSHQMGTGS